SVALAGVAGPYLAWRSSRRRAEHGGVADPGRSRTGVADPGGPRSMVPAGVTSPDSHGGPADGGTAHTDVPGPGRFPCPTVPAVRLGTSPVRVVSGRDSGGGPRSGRHGERDQPGLVDRARAGRRAPPGPCGIGGRAPARAASSAHLGRHSRNRWLTTWLTPPRMVTPYSASAISMVRFWWVMMMSCEVFRSSSNRVSSRWVLVSSS